MNNQLGIEMNDFDEEKQRKIEEEQMQIEEERQQQLEEEQRQQRLEEENLRKLEEEQRQRHLEAIQRQLEEEMQQEEDYMIGGRRIFRENYDNPTEQLIIEICSCVCYSLLFISILSLIIYIR